MLPSTTALDGALNALIPIPSVADLRAADEKRLLELLDWLGRWSRLEQELAALSSPTQPTKRTRKPADYYAYQICQRHDNLPPEARSAPRSMSEFVTLLQGRTPWLQPHVPEVAQALRELGWKRKRCCGGRLHRRGITKCLSLRVVAAHCL